MPAQIHVWNPTHPHGRGHGHVVKEHASLELSDGTYVSWVFNRQGDNILIQGFREDVDREGRKPDKTLVVKSGILDEPFVKSWWRRWWREEVWRHQMPVCPVYTVFEALMSGQKGYDMSDQKAIPMTNKLLIRHVKKTKLVNSDSSCAIL